MDRFTVEVISQTPNPQQTMYAAMHQDYAEGFVAHDRAQWPSEERCGEILVTSLLKGGRGHYGPLEHPQIVFNVGWFPHSTMQQIRTHRVGVSFDVQCLAGNTEVTFVHASGGLRKTKIAELYDLWTNGEKASRERKIRGRNGELPGTYRRDCKTRLKKMRLRVLNEETGIFEVGHIQDVMCSGLQPVYRLTLADGKTLDCTTNHRLYTSQGWQRMGDALGLVADANHQVLAITKTCELMTNGVVRPDALYSQESWLKAQINQGLTAQQIAERCGCSVEVIRHWARRFQLKLPSGRRRGLKTIAGNGLYRDKAWLQAQLAQGLYVDDIAALAGCSIESVKKWVYVHGLKLNKRSPGTDNPWNKGVEGYKLTLSEASLEQRRINAKTFTKRGPDSNFWKGGTSTERELIGAWTRQTAPQVHTKFNYICQRCGEQGGNLHAHHLVPVFADKSLAYEFNNLVSVCQPCHEHLHQNHLEAEFATNFQPILEPKFWAAKPTPPGRKLKAHPVQVTLVEYLGMQTTYDLEVEGPWHNFVANGVVVHNSFRYTGQRILDVVEGKREVEEVFYLRPLGYYTDRQGKKYEYTPEARQQDVDWCLEASRRYKTRIDQGFAEEHARGLIPFDIRQHWVMSANVRSVMHLLDLRWKADAQLEAQKMCEEIWPHFVAWVPAIAAWYEENRLKKARLAP
ncbi:MULTISPECIES: FAD-dependent thymidylate synthase [Cyanophyceae]|uniref:FAD-dependent thymidylate synthase n=1 Tax=Cyanophyceae TaxID=3028117 RepID=UPI0016841C38|nr:MULTISPECIES: FAD-dependent thymidylate synthase [Cyanophyceae]MBD1918954.1 FAD-dependent thymidylate synthase [Phormidium sp. FACHB-77]MBD2033204.1 FAD-dependent thymidylate synthase [Phormidium sp. FACHB-322]MBD2053863.1 FAD-dependent thymidylate synthase [Leptolyngbya sp. FACHB-60]